MKAVSHGEAAEAQFAANVALVRQARNLTQTELGALVGMGRSAIQAVEGGGRRIRLGEAVALGFALGVPLAGLVGEQPITIQLTTPGMVTHDR
jgi:transcriptional regulator with XRE-family HTH domain